MRLDLQVSAVRLACAIASLLLLGACSGGKERQAEYLARAQEHFAAGDIAKARVDVRNALQIDGNHAEARYLFALVLEKEMDNDDVEIE